MAITLVQKTLTPFASASSFAAAYSSNNAAGNTLIAVSYNNGASNVPTVTDTAGNTWVSVNTALSFIGTNSLGVFICLSCVGGANTVTYNTNGSAGNGDLAIFEYSGVTILDQRGIATGNSATPTSPSITTTQTNEMLFFYFATEVGGGHTDPSFTQQESDSGFLVIGDLFEASSGTFQGVGSASSGPWAAGILSLGPNAAPVSTSNAIVFVIT
jgi:hypothetical protein